MKVRENFCFFWPTGIFTLLFSPILSFPHDLFGQKSVGDKKSLYIRAATDCPRSDVCVEEASICPRAPVLEVIASAVAKEML